MRGGGSKIPAVFLPNVHLWHWPSVLIAALVWILLGVAVAGPAYAADETRLTDPNKRFFRLFVQGNGDLGKAYQDAQIERDTVAVRTELTRPGRQAPGSTWVEMRQPHAAAIVAEIEATAKIAVAGDEVTFYFNGHGHYDYVRLNENSDLTPAMLDAALDQLAAGVTVVVILDSCYGASFIDDLGEDDFRKVIAADSECPFDPENPFWAWFKDTFSEDIVQRLDDGGTISGQQLKDHMTGQGWDLVLGGPSKPKTGHSKCECTRPALSGPPSGAVGSTVVFNGQDFSASGTAALTMYASSGASWSLGSAAVSGGSFSADVELPDAPPGAYLVVADDGGHEAWLSDFVLGPGDEETVPLVSPLALGALGALLALSALRRRTHIPPTVG